MEKRMGQQSDTNRKEREVEMMVKLMAHAADCFLWQ